jgi:hypothetical protein
MQTNLTTQIRLSYDGIIGSIPRTGIMESWNDGLKKPAFKTPIISFLQHDRRIFKKLKAHECPDIGYPERPA